MKYIDAESLRAEIERRIDILGEVSVKQHKKGDSEMSTYYHGKAVSLEELLYFIDSLQQEQDILVINKKDWEAQEKFRKNKDFGKPLQQEIPETDKEKQSQIDWESEIEEYWIASGWGMTISLDKFKVIARYFIGLALNAKNKEIKWHYL